MAALSLLTLPAAEERPIDAEAERSPTQDWRRKDTFVATLAHELRQPLSAMLAAVEVARIAPGSDAARRAHDVMRRQLGQMSRLVEDLVDATRWAHGKVTLDRRPVDLHAVMRDAAADATIAVADAGQELVVIIDEREPIWINGDRQRLLQVVSNLLRNAVKYTPPGGRITMSIERMAWTVTLRVGDTGRGIEAKALPHVFDLFSQERPHEGTGLGIGLNVARQIVRRHGGSIEAHSEGVRKGSEFVIRLPLAPILG
jgi:signal transduction histidine kinase